MKDIALLILLNATSIICAISAVYLAINDKAGWGWFLFMALLTCVTNWKSGD